MITPALLALLAMPLGPETPVGTHEAFQRLAYATQQDLQAGRFSAAHAKAQRLPDREISIQWSASGIPAARRTEFTQARDDAVAGWKSVLPDLRVTYVTRDPEVLFRFVPTLPEAAAAHTFSPAARDPWLETTLAISRRNGPSTRSDIRNEVVFALGQALGLERVPTPGLAMHRSDLAGGRESVIDPPSMRIARETTALTATLRQAATSRRRLQAAAAQLGAQPLTWTAGPATQGDILSFSVQLTNRGNVPLSAAIIPDCGCFRLRQPPPIPPGETIAVPVQIETRDFPGPQAKNLYIYSNDPEMPLRVMPIRFNPVPRFRFLWAEPVDVLQVGDLGRKVEIFLTWPTSKPLKVRDVRVNGVTASVEHEPWQGTLSDPELKEGARTRVGERIQMIFGPHIGPGRRTVGLEVDTDDPNFPTVRRTFSLQRGIVALPANVFFGQLPRGNAEAWTRISRPGKPFAITRVQSDTEFFRGTMETSGRRDEHRLIVLYLGGAPAGDVRGTLTLRTDDPEQPTVQVAVGGVAP